MSVYERREGGREGSNLGGPGGEFWDEWRWVAIEGVERMEAMGLRKAYVGARRILWVGYLAWVCGVVQWMVKVRYVLEGLQLLELQSGV